MKNLTTTIKLIMLLLLCTWSIGAGVYIFTKDAKPVSADDCMHWDCN